MKKESKKDIKVFISTKDSFCEECKEHLGRHAWITLLPNKGAICLSCADLDYLVFLPSGNTALTRRSRKNSKLSAVVLKWSRARKRYERQGLLVEEQAIIAAEQECFALPIRKPGSGKENGKKNGGQLLTVNTLSVLQKKSGNFTLNVLLKPR
jgi:hypothetical protein